MQDHERHYMEQIEKIIEQFGTIQRNFVLDKNGIRAIVNFIEEFAGSAPVFSLDDPVVVKGRVAASKVVDELGRQLAQIQAIEAPEIWARFHESLQTSIQMQLDGYREMTRIFDDSDVRHLNAGQDLVNRGMSLLEGGART